MGYEITANLAKKSDNEKLLGFATVKFDNSFTVKNISIYNGKTGPFVAMPRMQTKDKDGNVDYKDVAHPITKDLRAALYEDILNTYNQATESPEGKASFTTPEMNDKPKLGVNAKAISNGTTLKGVASVVLNDNFVVENVMVRENSKKELFVAMPSYKTVDDKWKDIAFPDNSFREEVSKAVLEAVEQNRNIEPPSKDFFEKGTFENKSFIKAEAKMEELVAEAEEIFGEKEEKKGPSFSKDSLKSDLAEKKAAEKDAPVKPANEKKQEQSL